MKVTAEYITIPRDGETENGDAALVRHGGEGARTLLAVIDALGHGTRAAQAAGVATQFLSEAPLDRGVRPLIDGLHERLRGTRGAAAMLILLGQGKLEGCGVGNVEARGHNTRVPAVLTAGVLGSAQLAKLRPFETALGARGRFVIFSDGISGRLLLDDVASLDPRETCRALMDRYRRAEDDATVLVTDFEA